MRRPSTPATLLPIALVLALPAALWSCRDPGSAVPATDVRPELSGATWRLTYSRGDDRAPQWSAAGDSVFYSAEGFPGIPFHPGVLVGVPLRGGAARVLVPDQAARRRERWLTAPVESADRGLAYAEVLQTWTPRLCGPTAGAACPLGGGLVPPLAFAAIHVLAEELSLEVAFEGRADIDTVPGVPNEFRIDYYPFQQVFEETGTALFRPSWSPGGDRLVFSDGLRLLLWTPGAPGAVPVPGTEDGTSAAWSPDGEWIAFVKLERADSIVQQCPHYALGLLVCLQHRTSYTIGRRLLMVTRPDGSELRTLGEGEDPAWDPAGGVLYFRRGDGIWRMPLDGGAATPIDGTAGGREPAVSPDERHLAFSRRGEAGNHDIWILTLP